jgi:NADPH2:quinone reductase
MKALGFMQHGDENQMQLMELPKPIPKKDQVLIQVKASAFNHLDIWVRKGLPGLKLMLPHISGSDAAGIISELGSDVTNFQMGDRVGINPGINFSEDEFTLSGEQSESPHFAIIGEHLPGTHAEFIAVPAKNLIRLPQDISFEMAAAAGLVGLTAWRMLLHRAQIKAGETVLIIGAGGGVNSMAIQIAKLAGCYVYAATSTEEKIQQAKALGADHVYNYRENPEWPKELQRDTKKRGVDIVVDNVGKATLPISMQLVRRGGRIVIVGNTSGPNAELDIRYLFSKQISLIGSTMGNQEDYNNVMKQVFLGNIKPVIYKKFPLDQGVEAMRILEKGEQFGKIVLTP